MPAASRDTKPHAVNLHLSQASLVQHSASLPARRSDETSLDATDTSVRATTAGALVRGRIVLWRVADKPYFSGSSFGLAIQPLNPRSCPESTVALGGAGARRLRRVRLRLRSPQSLHQRSDLRSDHLRNHRIHRRGALQYGSHPTISTNRRLAPSVTAQICGSGAGSPCRLLPLRLRFPVCGEHPRRHVRRRCLQHSFHSQLVAQIQTNRKTPQIPQHGERLVSVPAHFGCPQSGNHRNQLPRIEPKPGVVTSAPPAWPFAAAD